VLPDLGLGALFEHDQGPPAEGATAAVDGNLDADRLRDLDPAGDVDQDAVAPTRLVAGDERVLRGDQGAKPAVQQLGVRGDRLR
jgi:hypothetical protein